MKPVFILWIQALVLPMGFPGMDWQQWRGPNRDGVVDVTLPEMLPKTLEKLWQREIGAGYSSPVSWNGLIFITSRREGKEWLSAIHSTTGAPKWEIGYSAPFKANSYATKYGEGPFATPLVNGGKVITVAVDGTVRCFDAMEGKELWIKAFTGNLTGDRLLFCGNTVSPLAIPNGVVVHVGDETHGRMQALSLNSGEELWRWEGDISGYASPLIASLGGVKQLISMTQNQVIGLDPNNGELLWSYPWQVQWRENIPMPLVHGNGLILSGREQDELLKLTVEKVNDTWRLTKAWSQKRVPLYMSSPVILGDTMVGFTHKKKGMFFALNASSGAVLWESPGRLGENAALLLVGNRILGLSTEGQLIVFPVQASQYAPESQYQVSDKETWAHPLLMSDGVVVRDSMSVSFWKYTASP